MVLREPGSGTRSVFEDAVAQLGIELASLRIAMELPSNEAVRAAVEAGLGATALSASVAAPSIESGLLHHVQFSLPQREFHVLRHSQRYRSRIADALLAAIDPSPRYGFGQASDSDRSERGPRNTGVVRAVSAIGRSCPRQAQFPSGGSRSSPPRNGR